MTDSPNAVPVMKTAQAGFAFMQARWREALPVAIISALGGTALNLSLMVGAGALVTLAATAGALATGAVFSGAAYRVALGRDAAFAPRFGHDEQRLIMLAIALAAFLMLVGVAAFIPVMLVVFSVAASQAGIEAIESAQVNTQAGLFEVLGPAGSILYVIGAAGVAGLIVWLGLRLCLAQAATVGQQRFIMLKTWPWTKGDTLRILGALLIAMAPPILIIAVIQAGLVGLAASSVPALGLMYFAANLASTLTAGLIGAGLFSFLYQGLRPPSEGA